MTSRALVLGGGGPVGVGWEAGMLKGLAEAGVHLEEADLIVGTSAGSIVGTQLAQGVSPADLYERQLANFNRDRGADSFTPDLETSVEVGKLWVGGADVTQPVRAKIGSLALKAKTIDEQRWTDSFADLIDSPDWPDRQLIITGVDIESGEFVAWDSSSGVPLLFAIAASCSVPGILPTVAIDGRRFMDGGLRSVSNADLAAGCDRVVILAPSGSTDTPYDVNTRKQLGEEVDGLRANGSLVEALLPDAEAVAAVGPDRMDPAALRPAAEAGVRQAAKVAENVRAVWEL